MKRLPIGRQSFEDIINSGLLYVDKTPYVAGLANGGKYYFLSRPRRFGKSLMLSTLKAYFEGKKELFDGLYISTFEKDWKKHPVIFIDYSFVEFRQGKEAFQRSLLQYLKEIARGFGLEMEGDFVKNFLYELVLRLNEKYDKVVVLVDEYDKPMVDLLQSPTQFNENRDLLRDFYGVLKGLDDKLRFVMLTGVSRFAKVSVFSGLNNLEDISMSIPYHGITGFTQTEIEHNLKGYLDVVEQKFSLTRPDLLSAIAKWYNGYSWGGSEKLYNPFSLLNFFNNENFGNYWFQSGTPSFLIQLIMLQKYLPYDFENVASNDLSNTAINPEEIDIISLLFQTGYLTISNIELVELQQNYYLKFPNHEVRQSFMTYLLAAFTDKDVVSVQPNGRNLRDALIKGDFEKFLTIIRSFFAAIPSQLHIPKEAYYHSLVYMLLTLTGVKMDLEKPTDKGRIDGVLEFSDKVYIIEFKFASTSRAKNLKTLTNQALQQIKERKYYEPYLSGGRKIWLIGIGFLDKKMDGEMQALDIIS